MQDDLSGFSVRLYCPGFFLCRYSCMYYLDALMRACVDEMVMSYA